MSKKMKNKNFDNSFITFLFLIFIFALSIVPTFAQIEWQRYSLNPVLAVGPSGSWDDNWVRDGRVVQDGDTLRMWYTGVDGEVVIGYAKSTDGINWIKYPNPVLPLGPPGSWDHGAVLAGSVIKDGDTLKMWYQGWASGYHNNYIGYATSLDGINWNKANSVNPVLGPGAPGTWNSVGVFFPSVIFDGVIYHMWYAGADAGDVFHIGYATSADGLTWNEYNNNPVLYAGSPGSWEEDVKDHIVVFDGTIFHMWYTGAHIYPYYRIGYATSPDGITWTKTDSVNPVLDLMPINWEQDGLETGGVLFDGITYKMWYSGCDGTKWRIGYASSSLIVDYVDLNRSYAAPGTGSILITTKTKDPTGITLFTEIEAPDQTPVDSLELFDDGNHNDGDSGDSLYANLWPVLPVEERIYYVDLKVSRTDTDTVVSHMNNMACFTTIGPVVVDSFSIIELIPNAMYTLELYLRNDGSTAIAQNVTVEVETADTNVISITHFNPDFGNIEPGQIKSSVVGRIVTQNDPNSIDFRINISSEGWHFWSDSVTVTIVGLAEKENNIPLEYSIKQNYPNPFNPSTTIRYSLPKSSEVKIEIFNLLGSKITTLVNTRKSTGSHSVDFDGSNLSSGVYLYRIQAGDPESSSGQSFVDVKKMLLLK
jgi:predicted GH43/DUF377 family glycosyl hydrolase